MQWGDERTMDALGALRVTTHNGMGTYTPLSGLMHLQPVRRLERITTLGANQSILMTLRFDARKLDDVQQAVRDVGGRWWVTAP
jgi:hypothetical protein